MNLALPLIKMSIQNNIKNIVKDSLSFVIL